MLKEPSVLKWNCHVAPELIRLALIVFYVLLVLQVLKNKQHHVLSVFLAISPNKAKVRAQVVQLEQHRPLNHLLVSMLQHHAHLECIELVLHAMNVQLVIIAQDLIHQSVVLALLAITVVLVLRDVCIVHQAKHHN